MKFRKRCKKTLLFILTLITSVSPFTTIYSYAASGVKYEKSSRTINDWCPDAPNDNVSVVCGTVRTSNASKMDKEIYGNARRDNVPVEGITVAIYEKNQISPTGQTAGRLTHLFSSTETNADGRYALTMRKLGPPDGKAYLVFLCKGKVVEMINLDTEEDIMFADYQINCPGDNRYKRPSVNQIYTIRDSTYSCDRNISDESVVYTNDDSAERKDLPKGTQITIPISVPVGIAGNQQPVVNNHVKEENYDIRHVQNDFELEGVKLPFTNINLVNLNFASKGGLRENDCILNIDPNTDPDGTPLDGGGSAWNPFYLCNATMVGEAGNGGSYLMKASNYEDYITRNWLLSIPKGDEMPYRRIEIRTNVTGTSMDPLAGSRAANKLWGGYTGNSDTYFRTLRKEQADAQETLPYCQNFKDCNTVPAGASLSSRNAFTCAGAAMMSYPTTIKDLYEAMEQADILDNPFCVDPRFTFTTENEKGETVEIMEPITLRDIQPPFDDSCTFGVDCGDKYKLGKEYFNIWNYMYDPPVQIGAESFSPNDSKQSSPNRIDTYKSDIWAANNATKTGSTISVPKSNKMALAGRIATPEEFLGKDSAQIMNIYEYPTLAKDPNIAEDYYTTLITEGPEESGGAYSPGLVTTFEFGSNLHNHCMVSNIYPDQIPDAADQEKVKDERNAGIISWAFKPEKKENYSINAITNSDKSFEPDSDFAGNTKHANSLTSATALWYSSEALDREKTLAERGKAVSGSGGKTGTPINNFVSDFIEVITDTAPTNNAAPTTSTAVNIAENMMLGRDVIDSIWSLIGGDTKMHANDDGVFVADITKLAKIILEYVGGGSPEKSFADRDVIVAAPTIAKDSYKVDYTLTENNFNNFFRVPSPADGLYWLDKEDWDLEKDDASENECYPWDIIDSKFTEKCNTYVDDKSTGISRTCRVNVCKKATASIGCTCHYKVVKDKNSNEWYGEFKNATCDIPFGDGVDVKKWKPKVNYSFTTDDCDRIPAETSGGGGRLTCAQKQTDCLPVQDATGFAGGGGGGSTQVDPNPEDPTQGNNSYNNEALAKALKDQYEDVAKCVYDIAYGSEITNLIKAEPDCPDTVGIIVGLDGSISPEDVSPTKSANIPLCDMGKAGPLVCNAPIEIGDAALRMAQLNPLPMTEKQEALLAESNELQEEYYDEEGNPPAELKFKQKNLDGIALSSFRKYSQWKYPVIPYYYGGSIGVFDALMSDSPYQIENLEDPEQQAIGRYTYGKEVEVGGMALATKIASVSQFPDFPEDEALRPIHYHCPNMGIDLEGIKDFDQYGAEEQDIYKDPDQDNEIGWACRVYTVPTEEPRIAEGGSCGITSCDEPLDNLSTTFKAVISAAANATNVPAQLIMASMYGEGGFNETYIEKWENDEYVKKISIPYNGRLDYLGVDGFKGFLQGDDTTWTAVGPFQFIKKWADATLREDPGDTEPGACELLNGIQENRCHQYRDCTTEIFGGETAGSAGTGMGHSCKEFFTASRMNLLDVAVMAGKALQIPGKACDEYGPADYQAALDAYSGGEYTDLQTGNLAGMKDLCR